MKRLFNEHETRRTIDLNGNWLFQADYDKVGETEEWYKGLPNGQCVVVPYVWNTELRMLNFEGWGWYQKNFKTNGGTLRLEFGSVMTKADVWLDGAYVGEHYGAFTQFEFIVNNVSAGEHTLVVRADSSFDGNSFPQKHTDWFNYGGIARDVQVDELNGISILTNHIVYTLSEDLSSALVSCELELYNANGEACTSPVSVTVGDSVIYEGSVTLGAYEKTTIVSEGMEMADILLWDTNSPKLYTVVAKTETDDLYDRIGFRKIEVCGYDILLNGKAIE